MKKMKLAKLSSEEIISMFEDAFESQVASFNNIGVYGVECEPQALFNASTSDKSA